MLDNDPEVKKEKQVHAAKIEVSDVVSHLESRVSDWNKIKRVVAYMKLFITKLKSKSRSKHPMKLRGQTNVIPELNIDDLNIAHNLIIKMAQGKYFAEDLKMLNKKIKNVRSDSSLIRLDPFLDESGLIRVGGRLQRSTMDYYLKHPVVIPKQSEIAVVIIRWYHKNMKHAGRGMTINEVRDNGIWIVNINSLVRSIIWQCVGCRILRGKSGIQHMSNLPTDRITPAPPFTYCGVDLFGPFIIKERRTFVKRYGIMFTCLSCRAVHIESGNSMDTDSFIMALRRFINRRGNVRQIRSDNGSNFIGAQKELQKEFQRFDHKKIGDFLRTSNADWLPWKNNPPYASHFGGVWERQIRTARSILNGLLLSHSKSLNDESFRTVLTEVECVVNSRPLTVDNLNDPCSLKPLTPNNLLTLKSKVVHPPPGTFSPADVYSRKHWRRTQHIVNEFWVRWRKEFLNNLQERSKWTSKRRNLRIGDVVLLKTNESRNEWPMAMIDNVKPDKTGAVRSVTIRLANNTKFERPISKLVMIKENEIEDSPPKEPRNQDFE